jgi:UDP-glucose 4-epimerase
VMSCIVTGSGGGLGRYLISELLENTNRVVIGISRKNSRGLLGPSGSRLITIEGDLRDAKFVRDVLSKYAKSTLIHCAANWNGFNLDRDILENNTSVTLNILNNLPNDISRFVYISSAGVYSDGYSTERGSQITATNSYGFSKQISEKLVREYTSYYGRPFTIWRPFHMVSPYEDSTSTGSHICTDFSTRLINEKETIYLDSENWEKRIPLTWVGDIAECIVRYLTSPKMTNQTYNIANSELRSVNEIAVMIMEAALESGLNVKTEQLIYDSQADISKEVIEVDWIDKLNIATGWKAKSDYAATIKNFIAERFQLSR